MGPVPPVHGRAVLQPQKVPANAVVTISCKPGCRLAHARLAVQRHKATMPLKPYFGSRIPAPATFEVRVSAPGMTTRGRSWRTRPGKSPVAKWFCVRKGKKVSC